MVRVKFCAKLQVLTSIEIHVHLTGIAEKAKFLNARAQSLSVFTVPLCAEVGVLLVFLVSADVYRLNVCEPWCMRVNDISPQATFHDNCHSSLQVTVLTTYML